jgi:glycerophosphoryl diester phosphodiesterase
VNARYRDRAKLPLADWKRSGLPFALVGHRGAAGLAPENTLPSFELAHSLGADAIELDVHLSRDGIPMVIHDDTIDRTTNGHGRVADLTATELAEFDAGHSVGGITPTARIPTLDAVLAWARGRVRVVIELKGPENSELIRRTIESVRNYQLDNDVLFISFDHAAIGQARIIGELIPGGILYANQLVDPVASAIAVGADVICPHWSLATPDLVSAAHAASLGVSVWTANDVTAIQTALLAGVDAVTTDFPDLVRAIALPGR